MSEPTRDLLRIREPGTIRIHRPTDAEFDAIARAEGYVRLDREAIEPIRWFYSGRESDEWVWAEEVHALIKPILDALEADQ